ncbi:serine hydrolase domain-containing protein [Paenibacillus glycanilyticus]|uniref:Beta-lactamase-related domain-containing protein n=1 Tax=Paenibacillus glycanilyticus TaxID=126569 RepID=A0ABQ6GD35_9BACL|nr:serine hydrolase domain-containing protein [Paenibacillus glycanilyticus]GLX68005.1 hypothetical protein MU1_23500 [Paenibacillus glycanilyticus]
MKDILIANNSHFDSLIDNVQQTQNRVGSSAGALVIIQDQEIVTEWYDGYHHHKKGAQKVTSDSLFNIYSTRKTYVGLATAIAIVEAGIDIDTLVSDLLEDFPKEYLADVTLRDLATKSGPKYFGPLQIEREELAAKVIERITGFTINQLITEKVLHPLQLANTEWVSKPKENLVCDYQASDGYASVRIESDEGHERNLYCSAKDLAVWGQLHLNKGFLNEKQILNSSIFELMENVKNDKTEKRIFGWYYQEDWYYATGATGCHCVILPEYNTVGVRMLNKYTDDYKDDQLTFNKLLLDCIKGKR